MTLQTSHKGFLVAIEGPDGAGKTTLRDYLQAHFTNVGFDPVMTREPGGTPIAERLRDDYILADRDRLDRTYGETIPPMAETLLFMAARALHVENMIIPRLERGELVITDRFCDSTFCYQGAGRGLNVSKLIAMHDLAFNGLRPDLTLVLDGDPEIFRQRLALRGESSKLNHFDEMGPDFHTKTRDLYRKFAADEPWRYAIINAEVSPEQVHAQVLPHLMKIDAHLRKRPETV